MRTVAIILGLAFAAIAVIYWSFQPAPCPDFFRAFRQGPPISTSSMVSRPR